MCFLEREKLSQPELCHPALLRLPPPLTPALPLQSITPGRHQLINSQSPLWSSIPTGLSLSTVVLFHFIQTFILYWFIFLVSWPFDLLKSFSFSSADGLRSLFFPPSNKSAVHLSGSFLLSMTFHGKMNHLFFYWNLLLINPMATSYSYTHNFLWDYAAANTTLPYTHSGPEHGSAWAFKGSMVYLLHMELTKVQWEKKIIWLQSVNFNLK